MPGGNGVSRSLSLSPHQINRLDLACVPIYRAWDDPPYLVGSVTRGGPYRDVDVRTILADDLYDAWFSVPGEDGASHDDPRWVLICNAVSEWLTAVSGLPVDYQIQRRRQANRHHRGQTRSVLGVLGPWSRDYALEGGPG